MAKIAVTGSTGFIGSNLVKALLNRGDIVYPIGRDYRQVDCDIIYHLACPSTTEYITNNTLSVMNIIMDGTRKALEVCPSALFVYASSIGAEFVDDTSQGAYNVAKRCMEVYIKHSNIDHRIYRIPSVYGPGMHDDNFIKRCVDGRAYYPIDPTAPYQIAHIDDVVDALLRFEPILTEKTTLGTIYEQFNSGRRGLHRPALITHAVKNPPSKGNDN